MSEAIAQYIADRTKHGKANGEPLSPLTITLYRDRLHSFLGSVALVEDLVPSRCAQLYTLRTAKTKPTTHRAELQTMRMFGDWLVSKGWLRGSHFHGVRPVGEMDANKTQLTIDEATRFVDTALDVGDQGSIAALTALLLGMRASEVVKRVVRDLDNGGRLLRIGKTKTKKGRRVLEVPEVLQGPLRELTVGKAPDDLLFDGSLSWELRRGWLRRAVIRLCKMAEVTKVTTQGLRGTHSSLAVEAGATSHVVAAALGHAHVAVTHRHYVTEAARQNASQRAAVRALEGARRLN